MGWTTGVQFPAGAMMMLFFSYHHVQTSPEAHPVAYPMGIRGYYPECKAAAA